MIGVFGGTFDPVHFGHLRPALELYESLGLDELRFVPCGRPPHREPPQARAEDRLAMLRAAVRGQRGFVVDTRELERPGPSYMVDTLQSLRDQFGPGRPLLLLLGLDAFLGLETWHRWERLAELAHLVVAHRPGFVPADLLQHPGLWALVSSSQAEDSGELRDAPAGRVLFCQVTQLDISASGIRRLLAAGRDIRYLVPEAVREIIAARRIYD